MSAFYFGTSERPLFGFYHQAGQRPVRRAGVVLCNPQGKAYLRTHRTLKQLAGRLADAGHHVLRFDYSGTGDSAGSGDEATLERWTRDVATAADELRAMAAVDRVSLVGVRLGAAVAAAAARNRDDLGDVVFWDPVVRGDSYLDDLLDRENGDAGAAGNGASSPAGDQEVIGIGGFPLCRRMRSQMAAVDLLGLDALPARRALLVVSKDLERYRDLERRLGELGPEVRREHRPGAEGWEDPGRMGTVVLVPAIVSAIADFLAEER